MTLNFENYKITFINECSKIDTKIMEIICDDIIKTNNFDSNLIADVEKLI